MNNLLVAFQKLMISQKRIIMFGFSLLWWLIIAAIVFGFALAIYDTSYLGSFHYFWGRRFGQIALLFYLATLVPGILKRLNILTPLRAGLMIYRRQLGVSMWWFALIHYIYVMMLSILLLGAPLPKLLVHTSAFAALVLSFLLWLTANDYSLKKLGKWWRWVHRLTYIILFLIFLHVALMRTNWAYLMGFFMFLEAISWIKAWIFPTKSRSQVSQNTNQPPVGKIDPEAATTQEAE